MPFYRWQFFAMGKFGIFLLIALLSMPEISIAPSSSRHPKPDQEDESKSSTDIKVLRFSKSLFNLIMPYAPTIVASAIDWTVCTQTGYGVPLYIVMEIVRQEHFDQHFINYMREIKNKMKDQQMGDKFEEISGIILGENGILELVFAHAGTWGGPFATLPIKYVVNYVENPDEFKKEEKEKREMLKKAYKEALKFICKKMKLKLVETEVRGDDGKVEHGKMPVVE